MRTSGTFFSRSLQRVKTPSFRKVLCVALKALIFVSTFRGMSDREKWLQLRCRQKKIEETEETEETEKTEEIKESRKKRGRENEVNGASITKDSTKIQRLKNVKGTTRRRMPHTPSQSGSNQSPPANDKTPTPVRSHENSRSRSNSQQHRVLHHRAKSPSRSRSPSPRPRKMSNRGSRYRTRSRSRSAKRYKVPRYSHSRSRSYSPKGKYYGYSDRRKEFYRSHSRSPMSSRRRHVGSRETPQPSRCLGVFGLSIYTTEQQLHHIMSKYGPVERVQIVIDAKTGRSRGFSFVYFESSDDAKVAKEQCTGMEIDGRRIRVDFSITQRAHTPTPGIYMGKPTYMSEGRGGGSDWGGGGSGGGGRNKDYYGGGGGGGGGGYRGGGGGYRGRSPSPYYRKRRYERSRSRSYSPRRY